MITAAEARAITSDGENENRERAKECVEKLSPYIKTQALAGNNYLFFFIEHLELEDLIIAELEVLGYEVFKRKYWDSGCPVYTICW